MRTSRLLMALIVAVALPLACLGQSAEPPAWLTTGAASGAPPEPGWDVVDTRLLAITARLARVESSLVAIKLALGSDPSPAPAPPPSPEKSAKVRSPELGKASAAARPEEPMAWQGYYATIAQKFYFHAQAAPALPHPEIAPTEAPPTAGDSVRATPDALRNQSIPQLAALERANVDHAKDVEGEIATMGDNLPALLARQRQLEAEQSMRWAQIVFRAVASRKITAQPIYRFKLTQASATQPSAGERLDAVRNDVAFIRGVIAGVEAAESSVEISPAAALQQLTTAITQRRQQLETQDAPFTQVVAERMDSRTALGRTRRAANDLEDTAANLQRLFMPNADRKKGLEDARRDAIRADFQENALAFATAVLAADAAVRDSIHDVGAKPDLSVALAPIEGAGGPGGPGGAAAHRSAAKPGEWLTSYDQALDEAATSGRILMADFTGSDWCGFCVELKGQVLTQDEFKAWSKSGLVLLELDFPQKKPQSDAIHKQNADLYIKFKITGFPTVIFLDGSGKELGRLVGYEGKKDQWLTAAKAIVAKGAAPPG